MAEQFLVGYAVDARVLLRIPRSGDAALAGRLKRKRRLHAEIAELLEARRDELTVEETLAEILASPKAAHAYEYRRVLQLVAHTLGEPLSPAEIVIPGRGIQELAPAWTHWKLPKLGAAWKAIWPWPWPKPTKATAVFWPIALLIPCADLAPIAKELAGFAPETIPELRVPKKVPRYGEADWDLEELAEDVAALKDAITSWIEGARKRKTDLLLWIDGQQ